MFSLDGERDDSPVPCRVCGGDSRLLKHLLLRDGVAFAVSFASLHRHGGANEAWFDVVLGPWDGPEADPVTFACRIGLQEAGGTPAPALVPAGTSYEDSPVFGRKLAPEEARSDRRLGEFWDVVDWLSTEDADIRAHLDG